MRLGEIAKKPRMRTYAVKLKLKQVGYTNLIDTTIMARNPEMARRILRQQYGDQQIIVGQPRELK